MSLVLSKPHGPVKPGFAQINPDLQLVSVYQWVLFIRLFYVHQKPSPYAKSQGPVHAESHGFCDSASLHAE